MVLLRRRGLLSRTWRAPSARFDGCWQAEPTRSVPFASRMLVRRPRDPAKFNGTVVVFWANVSLGFDIYTGECTRLYEGCAFVGVTAQRTAVDGYRDGPPYGLRSWDPERYGNLSIPTDDASYDIFTQAARLVGRDRPTGDLDPLGGLDVRHVVAFGASQSAGRLATYINAIQPLERAFDGFLLDVYFGNGTPLDTGDSAGAGVTHVDQISELIRKHGLPPGGHLLRDVGVPVFVVNSESESLAHFPVRQPDTGTYRFWEFAGHAHGTVPSKEALRSSWERDLGLATHPMAPEHGYNVLSLEPGRSAALDHMLTWLDHGTPPPIQDRIRIEGSPAAIVRDEHGNALGGIRMPSFAVADWTPHRLRPRRHPALCSARRNRSTSPRCARSIPTTTPTPPPSQPRQRKRWSAGCCSLGTRKSCCAKPNGRPSLRAAARQGLPRATPGSAAASILDRSPGAGTSRVTSAHG